MDTTYISMMKVDTYMLKVECYRFSGAGPSLFARVKYFYVEVYMLKVEGYMFCGTPALNFVSVGSDC